MPAFAELRSAGSPHDYEGRILTAATNCDRRPHAGGRATLREADGVSGPTTPGTTS
jgi:hypothetical protein